MTATRGAGKSQPHTARPPAPAPYTLAAELGVDSPRVNLRRLPSLLIVASKLVWEASRSQMLIGLSLQLAAAIAMGAQLLIMKHAFSGIVALGHSHASTALIVDLAEIVAATAIVGATSAVTSQQQLMLVELVTKNIHERIIAVASSVDVASFDTPTFYDQLERARTSALMRAVEMAASVSALFLGLFMSAGLAVALALLQPVILPFILLAGIPVLIATLANGRRAYTFDWELTPENRERNYLMEVLTSRPASKEIRIFGSVGVLKSRFDELSTERIDRVRSFVRARIRVAVIGSLAGSAGLAVGAGSLGWLLAQHKMSVATAVAAALGMQQLSGRLTSVLSSVGKLIECGMFLDNYRAFLALAPAARPGARPRTSRCEGAAPDFQRVELDSVSFQYPGASAPTLRDISLHIESGEVVAVVGENGSGKTTLVKLLCQLYRPTAGRVIWNGIDASDLDISQITGAMTVLFQDYVQYQLSVADNIWLGRVTDPMDPESIEHAARRAGAHEIIQRLPGAYNARLGRQFLGGQELSGGQWQRLALARAFFRNAPFLVLDEPTASLDPRAEHDLFTRIRHLADSKSVLLVSHRLASVRHADRIYLLADGRVTETGDHESLMALGGHYAELFELQSEAYFRKTVAGAL